MIILFQKKQYEMLEEENRKLMIALTTVKVLLESANEKINEVLNECKC